MNEQRSTDGTPDEHDMRLAGGDPVTARNLAVERGVARRATTTYEWQPGNRTVLLTDGGSGQQVQLGLDDLLASVAVAAVMQHDGFKQLLKFHREIIVPQMCEHLDYDEGPHPGCSEFAEPTEITCDERAVIEIEHEDPWGNVETLRLCDAHHAKYVTEQEDGR